MMDSGPSSVVVHAFSVNDVIVCLNIHELKFLAKKQKNHELMLVFIHIKSVVFQSYLFGPVKSIIITIYMSDNFLRCSNLHSQKE